jgi:hypothetical protein
MRECRKEFERFLRQTAMPFVSGHEGLVAQHVGRPMASSPDEFVYIAVWRDLAALRAFAGEDWTKALVDLAKNTCSERRSSATMRPSRHRSAGHSSIWLSIEEVPR